MPSVCEARNENDILYKKHKWTLATNETALVVVDPWDRHYLNSYQERAAQVCRERIKPVIVACRDAGIAIVFAPTYWVARHYPQFTRYANDQDLTEPEPAPETDWPPKTFRLREKEYSQFALPTTGKVAEIWREMQPQRRILVEIEPQPDDYVIANGDQLQRLLRHKGILHLLYAGFAANVCLSWYRDYSIMAMQKRGYNIILIRDCTAALEAKYTLRSQVMNRWSILWIEMMFGSSTTSNQIIKATGAEK